MRISDRRAGQSTFQVVELDEVDPLEVGEQALEEAAQVLEVAQHLVVLAQVRQTVVLVPQVLRRRQQLSVVHVDELAEPVAQVLYRRIGALRVVAQVLSRAVQRHVVGLVQARLVVAHQSSLEHSFHLVDVVEQIFVCGDVHLPFWSLF